LNKQGQEPTDFKKTEGILLDRRKAKSKRKPDGFSGERKVSKLISVTVLVDGSNKRGDRAEGPRFGTKGK